MELICLIGLNGSGKTTTAEIIKELIEARNGTACIESFSTPLKTIAKKHCGYEESKKNKGHRNILEDLAFDMKAEFGQALFAYALIDRIKDRTEDFCIIDDLRYIAEVRAINEFYPVFVLMMPFVSNCESNDYKRLQELTTFLTCQGAPYNELEDTNRATIETTLFGEKSGD